ncbi:hypothetical protein HDU97_001323 [Phlyctochytrium planicorne]|nr:hypothetical protein HDU97_001323 [Phlyctochytrium planicorne]
MDQAESDLLRQLFRENNELRFKYNALQRELYNKTIQNETNEEEIRALKAKIESGDRAALASGAASRPSAGQAPALNQAAKDLQEALFVLERKNAEIKQMREDMTKLQSSYDDQKIAYDVMDREVHDLRNEVHELRVAKAAAAAREAETVETKYEPVVPDDIMQLKADIEAKDIIVAQLRKQCTDIAIDANRKYNDQQNQLQGVEALIDGIRKEYDEFIQITKLENESYRKQQQQEFNDLKMQYDTHKMGQFEEKKRLMIEYSGLLYSMQSQFEEYRITAEFMFNMEIEKLEDELSMQALRYEHEIMYVIQAKDKFYADMMVSKDAKIMNLIEGSDLQTLIQKHELDIENLRKDHAREIERVKSDQESEQKNVIALLQRQNVSLESKCDKLQAHLKTIEMKIRELVGTIDAKNKLLSDREEQKIKMEADFEAQMSEAHAKIAALHHEKEHLRHKIIRMNLNARGEGENSIENMLKRISRETADLHLEFEQIGSKYDSLLCENQVLQKRLKEREKFAEFLEKEVARRTDEFVSLTRTFEEFLNSRARQARKERAKKLPKLFGATSPLKDSQSLTNLVAKLPPKPTVQRAVIPSRGEALPGIEIESKESEEDSVRKAELARGQAYLKRFKSLSRAFATGDFRIIPTGLYETNADVPALWQKNSIYGKLDDANLAIARLYKDKKSIDFEKPQVYRPEGSSVSASANYAS